MFCITIEHKSSSGIKIFYYMCKILFVIFLLKTFMANFFLKILQRNSKLVILSYLGMPGNIHLKRWHHFEETFDVYLRAKNQLHSSIFLEILQRYVNFLFWVLWTYLATPTQNHSINFQETLMFICMPKINFIIHFFLEIFHFRESCNLIHQEHFGL